MFYSCLDSDVRQVHVRIDTAKPKVGQRGLHACGIGHIVDVVREGQIVALLRDHGVDLKWEGRCQDKTFARPGRAYVKKDTGTVRRGADTSANTESAC